MTAAKVAVILFCVGHMTAIAAYLLPQDTASPAWNTFAMKAFNTARPYILSTSQWQKWDIFSPDPLRRSSSYSVDMQDDTRWQVVRLLDFAHIPAYERAKELKILSRIEESWKDMGNTFLQDECAAMPGAAGRHLRLQVRSFVLPKTLPELASFSMVSQHISETTLGTVQCPSSPSS